MLTGVVREVEARMRRSPSVNSPLKSISPDRLLHCAVDSATGGDLTLQSQRESHILGKPGHDNNCGLSKGRA